RAVKQQRQAERDDHAARFGQQLLQYAEGHLLRAGSVERVFAAVAGDAQLGQAEDADAGLAGVGCGPAEARTVAVPIEGRLVQNGGADADELHTISSYLDGDPAFFFGGGRVVWQVETLPH